MCARINDVSRIWANWPICLAYGSVGRYARGIPAHIGQLADMPRIWANWPICRLCGFGSNAAPVVQCTSRGLHFLNKKRAMPPTVKKRPASSAPDEAYESPSRKNRRLVSEFGTSPYYFNPQTQTRQSVADDKVPALLERLQLE